MIRLWITMILITSLSSSALAAFHYKDKVRVSNKDSFFYGSVGFVIEERNKQKNCALYLIEFEDHMQESFCDRELEKVKK